MGSWLVELEDALAARGIDGGGRARIRLELADHIACDPGCEERLGDPAELAALFADQLAASGARRSAWCVFWALAVAAAAFVISQVAIARAGGYPGFDHGRSVWLFMPAALGMLLGPQVALVAGGLAVLRAVRRRAAAVLPAAEISLIGRRCRIALAGGFATVAGLELYVVDFSTRLPGWWLGLVAGMAALGAGALVVAVRGLSRAAAVMCEQPGAAGDVFDDLPVPGAAWLRRGRWRLGLIGSILAGLAMTLLEAHAEHSVAEGLQRGITEGLAAAAGFALLARAVGLLPSGHRPAAEAAAADSVIPATARADTAVPEAPPSDQERAAAEAVLRASYAEGRLTVEELSGRLDRVHEARTVAQLRRAVADLPRSPG